MGDEIGGHSLVIFGCGGQGREIAGIIAAAGTDVHGTRLRVVGFVDDAPSKANAASVTAQGHEVLGPVSAARDLPPGTRFIIGISDSHDRERLAGLATGWGLVPATVVHPDATVGPQCSLGPGTVLWPGARLTTNVELGEHVHVNQNVTVGHDTSAQAFTTINPSAAVSGSVTLGRRSLIGAAAVVLQGRAVGDDAIVGAAACVVHDVPTGATVKGVPAK